MDGDDALRTIADSGYSADRQGAMATSTVVVAREDLTIPGAVEPSGFVTNDPEHIENQFFKTLEESKADAVLLDLTASCGQGVTAIRRIRRRSAVPILVVCRPQDTLAAEYRDAGATACMNPPVDLLQMKDALNLPNGSQRAVAAPPFVDAAEEGIHFADYVLRPRDNRLIGPEGAEVALSVLETRVLQHLAETPGVVWPAQAIAEAAEADGADADCSVGPVIARLRKKLARLGGAAGQRLIKTESGRGYMMATEAVRAWPAPTAVRGI